MANELKMATIQAILALKARRWSNRRIARELGIHRDTVARYLRMARGRAKPAKAPIGSDGIAESKPAKAPTGSDGIAESKPAKAPTGFGVLGEQSAAGLADESVSTRSHCEPFRELILEKLEQGLSAQRIFQDLVGEHGFADKYHSVRRFVSRLRSTRPVPFRRMECAAGEEAQVDFGTGAPIVDADGRRRRTYVFRIVLSHSRKAYSEAVRRQTTEAFVACLENAFWHFGGVPRVLIIDNLRAAVNKADWFEPELNPKVCSFCEHYGVTILPHRPYMPRHKGKVERGIDYVKQNALKGRVFKRLEEQNRHLVEWERTVADTRIHGTTRQQVGKLFDEVERRALKPLPAERFPFFHEERRSVHRDGHIEVEHAYYSVPPEYVGARVWVRWDARVLRIFNQQMQQLAMHVRHEPGRFSTQDEHILSKKISGIERGTVWLLTKTEMIGPEAVGWAQAMLQARGIEGVRVLMGLLSLGKRHQASAIEKACAIARSYGAYRLRVIRKLLERAAPKQAQLQFLDEHPIIRPISDYAQLVRSSFRKERP